MDKEKFRCCQKGCTFSARTSREVQLHAQDKHSLRVVPCLECPGRTVKAEDLRLHHAYYHAGETICLFCGDKFASPCNVSTHILSVHRLPIGTHEPPAQITEALPQRGGLLERMKELVTPTAQHKVLTKRQFVAVYDEKEGRPSFVYEELDAAMLKAGESRDCGERTFLEDPELPHDQVTPEAIKYLEFVNGHLAAARNHQNSTRAFKETLLMSNVAPMVKRVNCGIWQALEGFVRTLTATWTNVRVITGPIYNDAPKKLSVGCVRVPVPTHFFKFVLLERPAETLTQAYIVPNVKYELTSSIFKYRATIQEVETMAGLTIVGKEVMKMTWDGTIFVPTYKCGVSTCHATFLDHMDLVKHRESHATGGVPCIVCKRSFANEEEMTAHKDSVHAQRLKKCTHPGCGYTTYNNGHFNDHLARHTGEKKFQCGFCINAFFTQGELTCHERKHLQERPHRCTWEGCTLAFATPDNLECHMRTHTGEKPVKCVFLGCTMSFTTTANMIAHQKFHTGERKYHCTWKGCSQSFPAKNTLDNHIRAIHTGEKPYECTYPNCTKAYPSSQALRKHIRDTHEKKAKATATAAPPKRKREGDDDDVIILD